MRAYLNVKTSYSFLKSLIRIKEYVLFARQNKLEALVMTDDNLYGFIEFYNACTEANLKPVIGLRLTVNDNIYFAYAKNYQGLQSLFILSTYQSERKLTFEDINQDNPNLYIVCDEELLNNLNQLKKEHKYKLLEKRPVTCLFDKDREYVTYLMQIGEDYNYHFTSLEERIKQTYNYPFIDKINLVLPTQKVDIPAINEFDEAYNKEYLYKLCKVGLTRRGVNNKTYLDRLYLELETIISMGYVNYFLIVYDYVLYAKKHDILVGPGRGSAAGSLVAYALGITEIDPMKYNLFFERFLNPERISMPDIDLDFPYDKRNEVINYISSKYGKDNVANIITYGTFQAKQIVRDLAKVLNIDASIINDLSKHIDSTKSLSQNLDNVKLKVKFNASSDLKKLLKAALKLEGLPRHTSIHAAGIVISAKPLIEKIPLVKNDEHTYLTGVSMEYLEPLGLLKMDILAIRNLTLIDNILKQVNLNFNDIPLDDKKTFELFSNGLTEGIFQFEASGMKKFLQSLKPSKFEHLVAATALYRPGPMGNIYEFAKRKNQEIEFEYLHQSLEPILNETYGIIVYQEQIMQIAVKVSGFTMGRADILRKAMGKKDKAMLQKMQLEFIAGGIKNGYQQKWLEQLFLLVLKFADYGFPKAHAVSYAMISYKMAYLKTKYPALFLINLLNINIGSEHKLNTYINEAKQAKLKIVSPSINRSQALFVCENNEIIYPLVGIKGLGNASLEVILKARNEPFTSFIDFVIKCYGNAVKENTLTTLIKAGCFDEFGVNRQTLITNLDVIINYATIVKDIDKNLVPEPALISNDEYPEKTLLKHELEVFGFYLSNHPTVKHKRSGITNLDVVNQHLGEPLKIIVVIDKIKVIQTKNGETMAFTKASDETGIISITIFPEAYKTLSENIIGSVFEVTGIPEVRKNELQFIARLIEPI